MKSIIKISILLIGLLMLTCSGMMFFVDMKLLFIHESAEYLSDISNINLTLSVVFLIVYFCLMLLIFKIFNRKLVLLQALVLFLWLFSGRVVAMKTFPDARVIVGWYYIETGTFNLCKEDNDCETTLAKNSIVDDLPMWRVKIRNNHINKTIFFGPFTWNSCIKVLKTHIGK